MRFRTSFFLMTLASGCGVTQTATPEAPKSPHASPVIESRVVAASGDFVSTMTTPVTSFGAAWDERYAYVLGGYFGEPHSYSAEGQSRAFSRMSLETGEWEVLSEMPHGLQGLAMTRVGTKVCAFGGNEAKNAAGEPTRMVSSQEAWCYDTEARAWSKLPSLPAGRSSHEAATIGSTVYVAGGWRLDGDPSTAEFHRDILALDLDDPGATWRSIEVPFQRRAVGVTAFDGKLVVAGGIEPSNQISSRVDVYDPATGELIQLPDIPGDAFGVSIVTVGDMLVGTTRDGAVHGLRAGDTAWRKLGTLTFPRFFHQLVPVGDDALLAIGGISGMHTFGRTRIVERFELSRELPRVSIVTVETPFSAKNRQGYFLAGEHLYLFGGNVSLEQHDFEPHHFTDEGWRVHLPSLRVERVASYPERRQTMSTLVLGDVGLALGGFGHDGTAAVSHVEGFLYDFAANEFREGPSLPGSRTQFGLTTYEGALYVFGGLSYDPARGDAAFDHVRTILRAASLDAEFETLEVTLPGSRRAFAGAKLGRRYYLVGGMKENFQLVDDCLAFDFEQETFESIACPAARLSGELLPFGDRLVLVGGAVRKGDDLEDSRAIEVYDPSTDTWTTILDELPFETKHMRALVAGDRLLLVSTHFEEPRLRLAFVELPKIGAMPAE